MRLVQQLKHGALIDMKTKKTKDQRDQGAGDTVPIQIVEQRHFIRHPLCLPLSYTLIKPQGPQEQQDNNSETYNVSRGGLLFPSKRPVKIAALIAIKMPFEDKVYNIQAKVVRCHKNLETNMYDIAVKFFRLKEAFKVKMIEQIYLIAEYRDLLCLQVGKPVSLEEASRKWIKRYSARFKRMYW